MELFTKSNVQHLMRILQYSDDSEMQVCYNKWNSSCEIYRLLPIVKNSKFQFEFRNLLPLVDVLSQVSDDEVKYIIVVEREKRLVLCKNDKFGNWNLGYEMKRKVQNVEPIVADLDRMMTLKFWRCLQMLLLAGLMKWMISKDFCYCV